MNYSLLIILLALLLLILLFVRYKQGAVSTKGKPNKVVKDASKKDKPLESSGEVEQSDWMSQVDQSVAEVDAQEWEWGSNSHIDTTTTSVSAQEVDPLTEYQVYKQFGYEDKAAVSLSSYLDSLPADSVPEKLVHELAGLSLRTDNMDLLAHALDKHALALPNEALSEYIKSGLVADSTHLQLRVLAETKLGWDMNEVAKQIGEKTGLEEAQAESQVLEINNDKVGAKSVVKRSPLVVGTNKDLDSVSEDEMRAVIGFAKPEKSAKILKNKVDYETALQQYNRAIQKSEKPASLIIDALRLDYQHEEVGQFARHLWRLYYTLGQYGRQVKERMLGWGYSLGYHEVFDDLEKGPSEQQVREIGLEKGYLQPTSLQMKAKYRDLVQQDASVISSNASPADAAVKEVEALLMYGQLDQAIGTLEQAILQYPQESQLYVMLFDLYERSEDWSRLEQFLRILRERVTNLPEEVVLAMSRLLRRVNQHTK